MEFTACVTGGLALIGCGIALFRLRPPNWQNDGDLLESHRTALQRWSIVQSVVRSLNNSLMILIGILITATAFLSRGELWIVMWSLVLVLLLLCIVLAMVDACGSLAGYKRALPEAARRSFGNQDLSDLS